MKFKMGVLSLILAGLFVGFVVSSGNSYPERSQQDRLTKEFTLKDLRSKKVNLSDFKGKVVLLNFFATWCPPCRQEIPELVGIYHQYKKKGLVVLGVSLDMDKAPFVLKSFIKEMKIPYPILIGTQEVAENYQISGVPTTLIINKEGKIFKRFDGLVPTEYFEKVLKGLL